MLAHPLILWLIDTDLEPAHGYGTKMSPRYHSLTVVESQNYIIDSTNPCSTLHDSVQDRLYVRGRAADNTKHFGCRRLMFQRLAQFCIALLQFFEQANILYGDNGLRGECFQEC